MALNNAQQALNFDSNFDDSSGNNNNGSTTNVTIDTSIKKIGAGSALFNADADKVVLGQPYASGANNFSVSFWVYFDTAPQHDDFICSSNKSLAGANNKLLIAMNNYPSFVAFFCNLRQTVDCNLFSTTQPTTSTWYHVVITRGGTTAKMYVNGSLEDTQTCQSGDVIDNSGLVLGQSSTGVSFSRNLDQWMFYNRELSANEVQVLYNDGAGFDPYATVTSLNDAEFYLPFDADANDASGNSNNGTLTNGASISTATKLLGAGSVEMDNDTGNQYVNLSAHIADVAGNTNGSIALWFRLNEKNRNQGLVTVGDFGNVSSRFRLAYFNTPDELNVSINNGSWVIAYETVTNGFNTNTWYHLVLTQNGTASKLYINGEEAVITGGSNTNSGNWFASMTNLDTFRIGARAYSDDWFLDGFVDEFAYYDRALSPAEVYTLYNDGTGFNPYASSIPSPVDTPNGNQTWQMTLNDGVADRTVTFWKTKIFDSWRQDKNGYVWVGGYTYSLGASLPSPGRTEYYATEPSQQDIVDLFDNTLNQ